MRPLSNLIYGCSILRPCRRTLLLTTLEMQLPPHRLEYERRLVTAAWTVRLRRIWLDLAEVNFARHCIQECYSL